MNEESRNPLSALREVSKVVEKANGNTHRLEQLLDTLKFMLVVSRYDSVIPPEVAARVGGPDKVMDGVELLYERLMADPDLGHYFKDLDPEKMAELVQKQAKMLIALIGAGDYVGRALSAAHHPHHISEVHFEKLLTHVAAVLPRIGLLPDEVDAIVGRLREFRPEIVNQGVA